MVREENVDVVIVADQYMNLDGLSWNTDAANSAAIWAYSKHPVHENFERMLDRI